MIANMMADSSEPIFRLRVNTRVPGRWAIVLAGGEGKRMRPLISSWLGGNRPKQYCTFVGSRSMFEHTLDRARRVVSEDRIVTVIGQGHGKFLAESGAVEDSEYDAAQDLGNPLGDVAGAIVEQPGNFGTGPGVFLPLTYVVARDPAATVVLLPSDHFVYPEARFCEYVTQAFSLAERFPDRLVLVGAIPDYAESEYGWIDASDGHSGPRGAATPGAMNVSYFHEKPDETEARALFGRGCLWNTMVVAANAKTLWALGRQCLPEIMCKFEALLMMMRAVREGRLEPKYERTALASIYSDLAPADFSRDILEQVSHRSIVMPMEGVTWSDWGRPQRVAQTLADLGRQPLFPPAFAGDVRKPLSLASGAF